MTGNATSGSSRAEVRQRPPQRCARCARRIADGKGKHITGLGIICPKCGERSSA